MNDRSPFEYDEASADELGDDPYVDLDLDSIQPSVWMQIFSLIVSGLCITAIGILFGLVRIEPHPCALFFALIFAGPTLWIASLQWMAVFRCRPTSAMVVACVAYTISLMVAFQCVLLCCDLSHPVNQVLLPPYAFVAGYQSQAV
ncbi:MAG: hypothetical protein U0892_05005 [Pirellulales bacterium]